MKHYKLCSGRLPNFSMSRRLLPVIVVTFMRRRTEDDGNR